MGKNVWATTLIAHGESGKETYSPSIHHFMLNFKFFRKQHGGYGT
jgi:hypothetical protein